MRITILVLLAVLSTRWTPAFADTLEEVKPLLAHKIIEPVLPMAEVQRYCETRVPLMPKVESAEQWKTISEKLRRRVLNEIVFRGAAACWRDAKTKVEWLDTIDGGPGYHIKKLRYEALPGMWIPALLYEPDKLEGKVPVILNVNGHTSLGKQYPPKQIRCINQAKRGMLALNVDWFGMGQLRTPGYSHARMNQLDLCGASGLAPYYLNMQRALDVLLKLDHADPSRVAVTGLSGGGWQTIFISALDPRVTLSNPVAGYSSFRTRARHLKDLGDSEQTPNDLATIVDYTHLTAMRAPRPTLLTFNSKDNCCFESGYALQPLVDAADPIFGLFDRRQALRSHVNDDPGTHNFEQDNRQALYRMLGDFFFTGNKEYDWHEIPSAEEVKSAEELHVDLPPENLDFHTLALALSRDLPRDDRVTKPTRTLCEMLSRKRKLLREIVRAKDYHVTAIEAGGEESATTSAKYWRLQMDGDWTVPAVELSRGDCHDTVIVVADDGRQAVADEVDRLLAEGNRVIAVDPFYFGESKIAQRAYLFAILVAGVGDRPLGIQASQVAAVARWASAEHGGQPVTVQAEGPRASLYALVATALDDERAIAAIDVHKPLSSLKQVIENDWSVNEKPEMFCFGLLENFDMQQIIALAHPRPVKLLEMQQSPGSDRHVPTAGLRPDGRTAPCCRRLVLRRRSLIRRVTAPRSKRHTLTRRHFCNSASVHSPSLGTTNSQ